MDLGSNNSSRATASRSLTGALFCSIFYISSYTLYACILISVFGETVSTLVHRILDFMSALSMLSTSSLEVSDELEETSLC